MNKRRIGSSLTAALLLCGLLVSGTAMAGAKIGQFRVGVHVVNSCQIAGTQAPSVAHLPSTAGFGLKCSRGADFVVANAPAPSPAATEAAQTGGTPPPTVIIRF